MQSNLAARLQTDTERAQASRSHTYTRSTNRLGRVEAANNRFQNGVAALLTVSAQQHRLRTPKACRCWNHLIPLLFPSLSLSLHLPHPPLSSRTPSPRTFSFFFFALSPVLSRPPLIPFFETFLLLGVAEARGFIDCPRAPAYESIFPLANHHPTNHVYFYGSVNEFRRGLAGMNNL